MVVVAPPGTPASSTTKTGHHDIAEILLKVALNTINQIKSFDDTSVKIVQNVFHKNKLHYICSLHEVGIK